MWAGFVMKPATILISSFYDRVRGWSAGIDGRQENVAGVDAGFVFVFPILM
jgi:hypothetical protein